MLGEHYLQICNFLKAYKTLEITIYPSTIVD